MSTVYERVEQTRRGENPTVICRMPSGWAVLGDSQFLRGYSLLLPDPVVPDLNALDTHGRTRFLLDMVLIGDALLEVTGAARINYSVLGNSDPALHAHIIPRYENEPEKLRRGPTAFMTAKTRHSLTLSGTQSLWSNLEKLPKNACPADQ